MLQRSANEHYLQLMVLTATPAKLRFLLLERAVMVTEAIKENRMRKPEGLVDEKTLTLRDILGELLAGVKRGGTELSDTVADLYVFLLQELTFAEQEPGIERIDSIGHILEIEKETWQQVCGSQSKQNVPPPAMASAAFANLHGQTSKGLNFSA
jgi:flagellar protein FliS